MHFYPITPCGSRVMSISLAMISQTDAQQSIFHLKKVVVHPSGYTMFTCMRVQNLINICHVSQEQTGSGRTDRQTHPLGVLQIMPKVMIPPTYNQTKVLVKK